MRLKSITIEDFRGIQFLQLPLEPDLTVLHGENAAGKTSILSAIAVGLGIIPKLLADDRRAEFKRSDVRNDEFIAKIKLETFDGLSWQRNRIEFGDAKSIRQYDDPRSQKQLRDAMDMLRKSADAGDSVTLPVFAYYDTDRAVFELPQRRRDFREKFTRFDAYQDALTAKASFKALFEWFHAKENEELRVQRDEASFSTKLADLNAIRRAIEGVMPDVVDPHIEVNPLRFVVTWQPAGRKPEKLSLDQLSGGYRIVLALAADLAARMVQANPHMEDPLASEAIVLIDEIELHLHPAWQQRVVTSLLATFPNAQFIVSTHSPQVLTTVAPTKIVHLRTTANGVVAERETGPTYGAEAGDVLFAVMGVDERPPGNRFATSLAQYRDLIALDKGESEEALGLRAQLSALSPDDPALMAADAEIRRSKLLRDMAGRK